MGLTEGASGSVRVARSSLRRRILAVVLALGLVPAILALLIASFIAFGSIRQTLREQGVQDATSLSQDFDTRLARLVEGLRAAAAEPGVAEAVLWPPGGDEPQRRFMGRLPINVGELYVCFMDSTGSVLGSMDRGKFQSLATPPAELPLQVLERVERWLAVPALEEKLLLIESRHGSEVGLWLVAQVPTKERVSRMGVALRVPTERMFSAVELPPGSHTRRPLIIVSQREGVVRASPGETNLAALLNSPPASLFSESAGTVEVPGVPGAEIAFSRVQTAANLSVDSGAPVNWAVLEPINLRDTTASLSHALWMLAMAGLLLAIAVSVFGVWAANRLVWPVIELTRGVERLAGGELDYRVEIATGDELEDLAASTNQMAASLAESYKHLADKLLQLDEQAKRLSLTHQISQSTNRSLELGELFQFFTQELRELIPVDRMSLGLATEDGTAVELTHVYPPDREAQPKGTRIPLDDSFIGDSLRVRAVLVRRLGGPDSPHRERAFEPLNMHALCVIPLITSSGPKGVLALAAADPARFRRNEQEILTQVAENLALAVEHSSLFTRVKNFAEDLEAEVEERTRDLRAAQDKLVQAEKFSAAGKIAADLAHEINNPLSIIKNYLAIISGQLLKPASATGNAETAREGLRVIQEEIDRIARIVSQLRQLNAPQAPMVKELHLNDEVRSLTELFRATVSKQNLHLELDLDSEMGEVCLCSDYLRQILLNLLTNAADATEAGGSITVLTRMERRTPGYFSIRVVDTGGGITKQNLARIFDPFFTTKREGKGTGLGLSVSYGLAMRMGGTLVCDSEVGRGTTMLLMLPIRPAEDQEQPRSQNDSTPVGMRRSSGKIYLG